MEKQNEDTITNLNYYVSNFFITLSSWPFSFTRCKN